MHQLAVGILFAHFIADFVLQSNWMAQHKHHSWRALGAHVLVYTMFLSVALLLWSDLWWMLFNGLAHGAVDAVTSRITSWAWRQQRVRLFWIVIGFDQFIHAATLLLTWRS